MFSHPQPFKVLVILFFTTMTLLLLQPFDGFCSENLRETAVVKAVRKVSPVVVNINSEYEVRERVSPFHNFGLDPSLEFYFKDFFDPGYDRRYRKTSLGSGVIIDGKKGFILTNNHVIQKSGSISVVLNDGREFNAHIVGTDPESDLAVLRISSKERLPDIEMGNSDNIMIGETVLAIGNPFGFSNTVTTGVISAVNRSIRTQDMVFHDFIQTDASINPGNSGGPLLNINGDLIGINTAIYAKAQGIGFAIPINTAKRIVSDLIKYGEVVQAWLGIAVQNVDQGLAQYLNMDEIKGILVTSVEENGPARKAGIREGDIIVSIANHKILSIEDYQKVVQRLTAGQTIPFGLLREGSLRTVSVLTTTFPEALALEMADRLLGVVVENLSPEIRRKYRIYADRGVLIAKLHRQSYLAKIGAAPGDVIRQIDEATINDIGDFKKAIIRYRNKASIVIVLQRGNQLYNINVKL